MWITMCTLYLHTNIPHILYGVCNICMYHFLRRYLCTHYIHVAPSRYDYDCLPSAYSEIAKANAAGGGTTTFHSGCSLAPSHNDGSGHPEGQVREFLSLSLFSLSLSLSLPPSLPPSL